MHTMTTIGRRTRRSSIVRTAPLALWLACGLAAPAWGQVADDPTHGAPAPAPAAQGHLKFEAITHDFGRIMDTKDVEHVFRFTNAGPSSVVLNEPKGSCGCTIPKMAKFDYAPGESGEIKVIFKPAGKAGARQTQSVTVSYQDSADQATIMPTSTLTIFADVRTAVSVEPKGQVSFGEVVEGKPATQVVTVTGIHPDFNVTYASIARSRMFGVKLLGVDTVEIEGEKVRQAKVELTLKDSSSRGRVQSIVTFRTNDPQVPLASVQVDADVVGDIKLMPPRLNIGAVEPKQAFTRAFKVVSRQGKPFKITGIEQGAGSGALTFDITPIEAAEGVGYNVAVKGTGPEQVGAINATLTVKTDADTAMEVTVLGAVRPPPTLPKTGPMGPSVEPPTVITPPKPVDDGGGR
ncbi:MAG: DUF1573 domain-containing protein [Phycisphaerales bacterium]